MRDSMSTTRIVGTLSDLRKSVLGFTENMRFHVVLAKALGDLMGLRRTVVVVAGGLVPAVFFSLVVWRETFQAGTMSLEMQTSFFVGYFIIISFFWMAGFYLAYMVVGTSGLGLVDRERQEGTLLLMVSKPISRTQLLMGKFLALVLATLILQAIILLGSVLVFWVLLGLDVDSATAALRILPWIYLYSILVTLVFGSISIVLSTVVGSDTVRSVVFLVILMTVFIAGPAWRSVSPGTYDSFHVYYIDGSYNLGNAYVLLLDQAETGRMNPTIQGWLGISTGAYEAATEVLMAAFLGGEAFDPDIGAMPSSLERTDYIPPMVSIGLLLAVTGAAFGAANFALNRKEVQ